MIGPTKSLAAMLLAVAALAGTRAPAAVIISEIMFNPQGSDNDLAAGSYTFTREWVELYNTDTTAVDLSGWQFGDLDDGDWATPFPAGSMLGGKQALVVTGDAASFDANWGGGINRIEVGAFPNLANTVGTDEEAAIRNSAGVVQDRVRFQDSGWPTANGSDGNSIYLAPGKLTAADNDIGANWKPSSAGAYGARWANAGGEGENHGSPGVVATQPQAAFAPSPDAAWSMVVFPDTQNYSKQTANLPIFLQMTNWVKNNRDLFNIQVVLQEGDIVNQNSRVEPTSGNQSGDQQWANARAAMAVLDGHVPYIMAVGNHDLGTTSAQNRDTQFNDYFQASQNPLNDPFQGGILKGTMEPGKLENAFFELRPPDGRKLLVFSLEFWPRQVVVDWANAVMELPNYANHTAVLLTHSYLNWNGQRTNADPDNYGVGGDSHDGEPLWQELVKQHENFEITFSGHVGGDGVAYLKSTGVEGNDVHQMLINSQFETNGGNGWFRLVEFLEDGATVRVRTFSPFLGYQRTNAANSYEIELSQLPMTPGDFNVDGLVNNVDLDRWRLGFGATGNATRLQGDADNDNDVDGADFLLWQRNAGTVVTSHAVPEPAAVQCAVLAAALLAAWRVQRSRR